MKEPVLISSFIFTPDKEIPPGTPDRYAVFVDDVKVSEGEFSNLRENPIPQLIRCTPLKGRKITRSKVSALQAVVALHR